MTGHAVANEYPTQAYPGYAAPIVKELQGPDGEKVTVAITALFGLIPTWAKDASFGRRTYNARSETVAEKPSYRRAWRQSQFCLVPIKRFFEPCWETGRAVQQSIHRNDGEPFTVAAIWDAWTDRASGEIVQSFSMVTINADGHPFMEQFHKPGDEKRSFVMVQPAWRESWLNASPANAMDYLVAVPVEKFGSCVVSPVVTTASLF